MWHDTGVGFSPKNTPEYAIFRIIVRLFGRLEGIRGEQNTRSVKIWERKRGSSHLRLPHRKHELPHVLEASRRGASILPNFEFYLTLMFSSFQGF